MFAQGNTDEGAREETVPVNPFSTAIVCRNPEQSPAQRARSDPAWKKINADESFSVYKCPKPWTLAIKQYTGMGISQPIQANSGGMLDKLWSGGHQGESLNYAGLNAHELARYLRSLNFEAYVLHTRTTSVVTVGAYDTQDDPAMDVMRQRLNELRPQLREKFVPKDPVAMARVEPFELFHYPMPMEVPR